MATEMTKDMEEVRDAILEEYEKARIGGADHEDAVVAALHEVRRCSEEEARVWVAEKHGDQSVAAGRWEFDAEVTASFEDMLGRSIPNYEEMRRFVTDATVYHLSLATRRSVRQPLVVDLGASRGSALAPIVDKAGARARYLACDISEPMLGALRERFTGWTEQEGSSLMHIRRWDLRDGFPDGTPPATVVLSVLTLMFIPIEYRPRLLGDIYAHLVPGGAFILVEKVMGSTPEADALINRLYWDLKQDQGYSAESVERKRLSLEGVLVPLTARFNEELLHSAGFADPECVWAWGPFRGWLAVKR